MIDMLIDLLPVATYLGGTALNARQLIRWQYDRELEYLDDDRLKDVEFMADHRRWAARTGMMMAFVWPVPVTIQVVGRVTAKLHESVFRHELIEEKRARDRAIIEADEERDRLAIETALAEAEKPKAKKPKAVEPPRYSAQQEWDRNISLWSATVERDMQDAVERRIREQVAEKERRLPPYTDHQLLQLQRIAEGLDMASKIIGRMQREVSLIDQTLTIGESPLDAAARAAVIETNMMVMHGYVHELKAIRDSIHANRGKRTHQVALPKLSVD